MYKKINSSPDIYIIYVPLPNNPLKELNCYVIKTKNKNLIIDTGFNMPECYEALSKGLNELKIDIDKTDLFLTHLHADHTGLTSSIMKDDSTIYMSKPDYDYIDRNLNGEYWESMDASYLMEGFDENELKSVRKVNPSKIFNIKKMFDTVIVEDNFKFNIGEYEFTCISTCGHTPGHMCLYMENEKILFSGDHILFDITPNITRWKNVKNSLADYLNSLEKIKRFDISITLPAHRGNKNNEDVYERIEQIIHHHRERLEETAYIVASNSGINAYDVAGKMKWSMHGKRWDEAPVQQKWFAVGEALAHLDYLELENKVYKELKDNIYRYYV
jgi:glyoxylase-like metal-dependent hydrolase (beta-lactamase superfamily II)